MLRAIDRLATSAVLLGLLGGAAYFAGVAFFTLVPPAWDSWSRHYARIQAEEARGDRIRKSSQAQLYGEICPLYYEQGLVARWTGFRDMRWCEDYRSRFKGRYDG